VIASRERCYHGLRGFGTSLAGLPATATGYGRLLPDVVRVPHDDWTALEALFADGGADRIAAFFCEPIIGTGGVLHPPEGYLDNVRRLCREHDVLFVADEVITGFGRVGAWFASTLFDLKPDLLLFAKGVTSGYQPLGGVLVSERVAAPFWADGSDLVFRHGLTYRAMPQPVLQLWRIWTSSNEKDLVSRAARLSPLLARLLRELESEPAVVEIRAGLRLLGGVVLRDLGTAAAVVERCWELGVLTRQLGEGDVLHICPPLVITEDQVTWTVERIGDAIADVCSKEI
jgi:putrescine---pyruvate transaminase